MNIDRELQAQIKSAFLPLNKSGARTFPSGMSLSLALEQLAPSGKASANKTVDPEIAQLFATASVDIWLRALHSLVISASLTASSPIWAAVSGYYASHYAIRALAHALGYFQLYKKKKIVRLKLHRGKYFCVFDPKGGNDREHQLYWKSVKQDPHFVGDPLFTRNDPGSDNSDVGHRERANYADHLYYFPQFHPLDLEETKVKFNFISNISFRTPPIPRISKFPDTEAVQVIAYHRIVKFRRFVDEILGSDSRFWSVHRSPSWASSVVDFQLVEQAGLEAL